MMSRPPGGRCAICRALATKWAGSIDELPDGRVRRFGIGVCDDCLDRLSADQIAAAARGIMPSDEPPSIAPCDAPIVVDPQTNGE